MASKALARYSVHVFVDMSFFWSKSTANPKEHPCTPHTCFRSRFIFPLWQITISQRDQPHNNPNLSIQFLQVGFEHCLLPAVPKRREQSESDCTTL